MQASFKLLEPIGTTLKTIVGKRFLGCLIKKPTRGSCIEAINPQQKTHHKQNQKICKMCVKHGENV